MAGIIVTATDEARAWDVARALARGAQLFRAAGAEVYGPAPAPVARIRGRHRQRLLVKAPKGAALQPALRAWAAAVPCPSTVRVSIDIDPQTFF
jgi:primosomal protein N' (replication factor Y)